MELTQALLENSDKLAVFVEYFFIGINRGEFRKDLLFKFEEALKLGVQEREILGFDVGQGQSEH